MFGIATTYVLTLHGATGNSLAVSIEEQNIENLVLKETIEILEKSLNLDPFLMSPITICIQQSAIPTTSTSHGSIGYFQLASNMHGKRFLFFYNWHKKSIHLSIC